MPLFLLLALVAAGALYVLTRPSAVTAYIDGQPSTIEVVYIGNGAQLEVTAAASFFALKAAAFLATQRVLQPSGQNAGYRTPEVQAALRGELGAFGEGGLAAAVGKSPHQAGIACDFLGFNPATDATFEPELRAWVVENCRTFGWVNAGDAYRTTLEPWHYEYRGVGNT